MGARVRSRRKTKQTFPAELEQHLQQEPDTTANKKPTPIIASYNPQRQKTPWSPLGSLLKDLIIPGKHLPVDTPVIRAIETIIILKISEPLHDGSRADEADCTFNNFAHLSDTKHTV